MTAMSIAAPDGNAAGEMVQTQRAVLEELNLARTRPADYVRYLDEHKRRFTPAFYLPTRVPGTPWVRCP